MEHSKRFAYRICAPNLHISKNYRPAEGSYPLIFAEISAHVKSEVKDSVLNLQLTIDDAVCFDHGKEMSRLAEKVGRFYFTQAERKHLGEQFALARQTDTNTLNQELDLIRVRQNNLRAPRSNAKSFPEARSCIKPTDELPPGIQRIIDRLNKRSEVMVQHGANYTHWTEELKVKLKKPERILLKTSGNFANIAGR